MILLITVVASSDSVKVVSKVVEKTIRAIACRRIIGNEWKGMRVQ